MIDLTKIGFVAPKEKVHSPIVAPKENPAPQENLRVPNNPEAKEFRKNHWTPDKFVDDGQIRAGEIDAQHEQFLKETEHVE